MSETEVMGKSGSGGENSGGCQRVVWGVMTLVDSCLSIFVFAPLVVFYWRGCWQLMDLLLLPDNQLLSVVTSLAIGLAFGLIFCLTQGPLNRAFDHSRRPGLHLLASRVYTSIYCVCCVNHWRGVWQTWDMFTGISWQSGATSLGIGLLTLAFTRGLKNILAPPFIVIPDHPDGYFDAPTLFGAQKDKCGYFLLDTIFTVVVTGTLVVFVWRGTWVCLDNLLFPDNATHSAWGSLILGMTVTLLGFLAQLVLVPCSRHIRKGLPKIVLEDVYHSFCFVGDVNVWRGVWNLLNIYFLPDKPLVSNLLTAITGLVVLMCFYTANSILVRGAVMDGAGQGSKGIVFPTFYLRFFYKRKKMEERKRNDPWVETEGQRAPLHISAPLEATLSSKANGLCDGRGFGDGHSLSGGFSDGFSSFQEEESRCHRPISFLSSEGGTPVLSAARPLPDSDRPTHIQDSETPL